MHFDGVLLRDVENLVDAALCSLLNPYESYRQIRRTAGERWRGTRVAATVEIVDSQPVAY